MSERSSAPLGQVVGRNICGSLYQSATNHRDLHIAGPWRHNNAMYSRRRPPLPRKSGKSARQENVAPTCMACMRARTHPLPPMPPSPSPYSLVHMHIPLPPLPPILSYTRSSLLPLYAAEKTKTAVPSQLTVPSSASPIHADQAGGSGWRHSRSGVLGGQRCAWTA